MMKKRRSKNRKGRLRRGEKRKDRREKRKEETNEEKDGWNYQRLSGQWEVGVSVREAHLDTRRRVSSFKIGNIEARRDHPADTEISPRRLCDYAVLSWNCNNAFLTALLNK